MKTMTKETLIEDDDIANTLINPIMTCVHLLEDIDTDEHHATIRDNITEY
jgi:hypothetical protein